MTNVCTSCEEAVENEADWDEEDQLCNSCKRVAPSTAAA
jgi:hypothetical protein